VTANPGFKVTVDFQVEYFKKMVLVRLRELYYSTLIGNSNISNGTMFGDLD